MSTEKPQAMQLSRLEELALITRCLAGDSREAFGRLVVAYEGGLRRFLLNLTLGDASLTDDLAQETFLKAYLAIRSFRGVARFKTWLYSIAYREFLTYRRGQHPDIDLDDAPPLMAPGDTHAVTAARLDVAQAMLALNDNDRTVTLLFYLEDQPIDRIVKITGMPQGTVKSYLNRSRQKMAKYLDE